MPDLLNSKLRLPCGVELKNRIAKSAMSEGWADSHGRPTAEFDTLYRHWSSSGVGLLVTGNVQVDRACVERPGNVAFEVGEPDAEMKTALKRWATASTQNDTHCWVQISHAGRQTCTVVNKTPKGVSGIALEGLPKDMTGDPVALTTEEVKELVARFATVARACKEAGFTGVQLHAAHGYLLSAFLNPKANDRTDEYGGSLENRARFLLEAMAAVRAAVGPAFPIGVKLNSADFQKGGMTEGESEQVALWLEEQGCDLLEISGGNYESPAMMGAPSDKDKGAQMRESTKKREAYFLEFAENLKQKLKTMPLMVTGGFRSRSIMLKALEKGDCAVVGVAKPFLAGAERIKQFMDGSIDEMPRTESIADGVWWPSWLPGHQTYTMFGTMTAMNRNMLALARGEEYRDDYWFVVSIFMHVSFDQNKAKELKGVDCVGTHYKGLETSKTD